MVLADRAALADLERILNPGVRRAIEERIAQASAPVLVLDAIRLIEAGLAERCDTVWVVVCDRDAQMQRLRASRALTADQAALRIAAQTPAESKLRHANAVITNDGNLDDLTKQVDAAWRETVLSHLG
jgi:dephospho-CoA kinase